MTANTTPDAAWEALGVIAWLAERAGDKITVSVGSAIDGDPLLAFPAVLGKSGRDPDEDVWGITFFSPIDGEIALTTEQMDSVTWDGARLIIRTPTQIAISLRFEEEPDE